MSLVRGQDFLVMVKVDEMLYDWRKWEFGMINVDEMYTCMYYVHVCTCGFQTLSFTTHVYTCLQRVKSDLQGE